MTHLYTGTHTVQGACPTCGKRIAVQVAITPRLTVTTEKSELGMQMKQAPVRHICGEIDDEPLPGMTEPTEARA